MNLKASVVFLSLLVTVPVQAAPITVDFSGTATGATYAGRFLDVPFTAEFVFETDLGAVSRSFDGTNRLDGGLQAVSLDLGSLGTWGSVGLFARWAPPFLEWSDDFSFVQASAGGLMYHLFLSTVSLGHDYGVFQFGACPGFSSGPCGYFTSAQDDFGLPAALSVHDVPGPVAGGGILGGLLALLGFFRWSVASQVDWRIDYFLRRRRLLDGSTEHGLLAWRKINGIRQYRLPTPKEEEEYELDTAW